MIKVNITAVKLTFTLQSEIVWSDAEGVCYGSKPL